MPNILNVDVNGNTVLNGVDSAAASEEASGLDDGYNTNSKTAIPQQYDPSYYAPGSLTGATLDATVITQFNFTPGDVDPTNPLGTGDVITVQCGGVTWCEDATTPGFYGATGLTPEADQPDPYQLTPNTQVGVDGNGFMPWGLAISPAAGTPASDIEPGQTFTINVQESDGSSYQVLEAIAPFMGTSTYVANATFENEGDGYDMVDDSAGNPIGGSGTISLDLERPERIAMAGETSSSGLMDQAGLSYAVSVEPTTVTGFPQLAFCPGSAYSSISGATLAPVSGDAGTGEGLLDSTTNDFDPAESDPPGPITFDLDLSSCLAANDYTWTSGQTYLINLSAWGVVESGISTNTIRVSDGS